MANVFLIPGLGADTRIYKNMILPGYGIIYVDWIDPDKSDTLSTYAQKLIDKYLITESCIVIGNSLGGMIAIEIAKRIKLDKVILISSIKTVDEAPGYFKFFKNTRAHHLVPSQKLTSLEFVLEYAFGGMTAADRELFKDMLRNTSPVFVKWAIDAILNWDNHFIPSNVYHITGDNDKVFPYKNIRGAAIIKGGTHVMVYDRAPEINAWLQKILGK